MKASLPIIIAVSALLAGCNTMRGMGKDVSSVGNAVAGSGSSAAPSGSSAAQTPGVSAETVQHAQSTLQAQGLYHGPVDGIYGPETQSAVTAYQQQKGLPATGQLDSTTLQDLTGSSSP
jgi:peptidoglycan hydrolase-like protein with peptidoglycan-binding domain